MNKGGGIGVGSASIVLVFAVLCLTVFSLITFMVAGNDNALVVAEAQLVTGYYKADALAEHIISEIYETGRIPGSIRGVDIETARDEDTGRESVHFLCPISDSKALYVELAVSDEGYDILSWRMHNTDTWVIDDSLDVWRGEDN